MNLTKLQWWERFQKYCIEFPKIGLALDLSRMNVDDAFFAALEPRAQKALADVAALEKDAIANPDENRMAGHYWLRNSKLAPTPEITGEIEATLKKIKDSAAQIHAGKIAGAGGAFKNFLLIGIGGAKETRNGMLIAQTAYEKVSLNFGQNVVTITISFNELGKYKAENKRIEQFPTWDWVGGQTSELSAVGLLPAALRGINIDEMLRGQKECDQLNRVSLTKKSPCLLISLDFFELSNDKVFKTQAFTIPEIAEKIDAADEMELILMELIFKIYNHLSANSRSKIKKKGSDFPSQTKFSFN